MKVGGSTNQIGPHSTNLVGQAINFSCTSEPDLLTVFGGIIGLPDFRYEPLHLSTGWEPNTQGKVRSLLRES